MKLSAAFLHRPLLVHAIQIPFLGEDIPEEWWQSLHQFLQGFRFEAGLRGKIAVFMGATKRIIAGPGEWLVADRSQPELIVLRDEEFRRKYVPAELAELYDRLEQERFHVTTP